MKIEATEVSEEVKSKVIAYVQKNYDTLKESNLTITQGEKCFYVYKHKDGGPMILGKGIIG